MITCACKRMYLLESSGDIPLVVGQNLRKECLYSLQLLSCTRSLFLSLSVFLLLGPHAVLRGLPLSPHPLVGKRCKENIGLSLVCESTGSCSSNHNCQSRVGWTWVSIQKHLVQFVLRSRLKHSLDLDAWL